MELGKIQNVQIEEKKDTNKWYRAKSCVQGDKQIKETPEDRKMSVVSLYGGLEATVWSCEGEAWIACRQQNLVDTSHAYLPRKAAYERVEPAQEKEVCCSQQGVGEHFDIRHRDADSGLYTAGFRSCFGPVFPHYSPFPSF